MSKILVGILSAILSILLYPILRGKNDIPVADTDLDDLDRGPLDYIDTTGGLIRSKKKRAAPEASAPGEEQQ